MKTRRVFTVPNLLSFLRLLVIPVFVWTYLGKRSDLATALVLALSGLTDMLDGRIARRFGQVSDLGKMLDPVADKLTQGAMLICLVTRFPAMWIPLILLAVKEAFVGITSLIIIRRSGRVEGAVLHGKIATCFLYGLMLIHLLWGNMPGSVSACLIALTTGMMLLSMILYGMRNMPRIRRLESE